MTAVEVFQLAVSCYLREMDDAEFDAFTRRVRPPTQPQSPDRNCSTKGTP